MTTQEYVRTLMIWMWETEKYGASIRVSNHDVVRAIIQNQDLQCRNRVPDVVVRRMRDIMAKRPDVAFIPTLFFSSMYERNAIRSIM